MAGENACHPHFLDLEEEETEFPNFGKKDNLRRLSKIFEISFQKHSVPFDIVLKFRKFWSN